MSQIKIGFHAVNGNITLAVLIRIERARIYIDIGVKLLNGDIVASGLQEFSY